MKLKEAFGDNKHFATMPIQHLHSETHNTLGKLGFKPMEDDPWRGGIRKDFQHDFRVSHHDASSDLEDHLKPHGWYKLGGDSWGGAIYNHPNGGTLIHKSSNVQMYGNFSRSDK